MYMYIYIFYIYIKNKTFIIHELYFSFFQTFKDFESSKVWKKPKYNS